MTYRWEYLRCQMAPFNDRVVSSSSRTFLNKSECIINALMHGSHLRLDIQVVLCVIKERDDMLTSPLSNYAARITTFQNWPPSITIPATIMAAAGFFYEGQGDRVTCYSCGKSLKFWKATDNPWSEHQRHSPGCAHLNGPAASEALRQYQITGNRPTFYNQQQGPAEVCDGGDIIIDEDENNIDMTDNIEPNIGKSIFS